MKRNTLARIGGLALALGSNALAQEQVSAPVKTEPAIEFKYQPRAVNLFVKNTIASKYRVAGGFVLSDEPVNQTLVSLSTPDVFVKGDNLDGYVWGNLDLEAESVSEVDVGVDYTFPITDEFLGGKLTGYTELAHWEFPDGRLGENVKGLIGKINYEGPINASFKATQLFTSGSGREFDLTLSKSFKLGDFNGAEITASPVISVAYLDGFFGDGFSNVQYGGELSIRKGNQALEFFVRQQEGLQEGFEDGLVAGVGYSIGF